MEVIDGYSDRIDEPPRSLLEVWGMDESPGAVPFAEAVATIEKAEKLIRDLPETTDFGIDLSDRFNNDVTRAIKLIRARIERMRRDKAMLVAIVTELSLQTDKVAGLYSAFQKSGLADESEKKRDLLQELVVLVNLTASVVGATIELREDAMVLKSELSR